MFMFISYHLNKSLRLKYDPHMCILSSKSLKVALEHRGIVTPQKKPLNKLSENVTMEM